MDLKARCGLAVSVIALTGCGGGDPDGAGDAPPPEGPPAKERVSKAEAKYVERLDAACKEGDEISGYFRGQANRVRSRLLGRAQTRKMVVELLNESYVEADKIRDRIRRLEAPPGQERFRRRYIAYSDRLDVLNRRGRDAIARGEDLGPVRLKANLVRKRRADLVDAHGGFRYCG